jgi:3-phosphoshikimate 1-carboxyvinyltransferase
MEKLIEPRNRINGEVILPGDKSISHRAVMVGAIARGETCVKNLLDCDDCNFTIQAFQDMGVRIQRRRSGITSIRGRGLRGLKRPEKPIYLGNSGTSMRILAGILAGQDFEVTLTGDKGLLKRPMRRVVEPLREMGADVRTEDNEHPPMFIKGERLIPMRYLMEVPSAQVKSAILFAALYARGLTVVKEKIRSRDHTERMLKFFGADIEMKDKTILVRGGKELSGKNLAIPGDISSAAFFIVGATLMPGSRVTIRGVSINPTRAGILDVLKRMGARVRISKRRDLFEPVGDIEVESARTRGVTIPSHAIPSIIDEIPIIAALASRSRGRTLIKGIGELRVKETDRVESIVSNLSKMGADIRVEGDTMVVNGVAELYGTELKSYGDHRTAMAMTVAAMAAKGSSKIDDPECVSKSFPQFFEILEGAAR